jgi:hypothetical protein
VCELDDRLLDEGDVRVHDQCPRSVARDLREEKHVIGDVVEDAEEKATSQCSTSSIRSNMSPRTKAVRTGNAVELHVLPALEHEAALVFYPDDSGGTAVQRGEAPPSVMTRKIENSGSIEELTIRVDERGVTAVEPLDPLPVWLVSRNLGKRSKKGSGVRIASPLM